MGPFKYNLNTIYTQLFDNWVWPPATPPKVGAAASGRRPHFGMSICHASVFKSCLNGIKMVPYLAETI